MEDKDLKQELKKKKESEKEKVQSAIKKPSPRKKVTPEKTTKKPTSADAKPKRTISGVKKAKTKSDDRILVNEKVGSIVEMVQKGNRDQSMAPNLVDDGVLNEKKLKVEPEKKQPSKLKMTEKKLDKSKKKVDKLKKKVKKAKKKEVKKSKLKALKEKLLKAIKKFKKRRKKLEKIK